MKNVLIYFLVLVSISIRATEPIKIGVITDTHYLSEKLMDGGYSVEDYVHRTGRDIHNVPAILDKVLKDYLNSDIQVLLICGDITKDGEKQSHIDFVKKLKPLQDKGVKVCVVPGNHDVNISTAVEFKGNKTFPVKGVSSQEFSEIYRNCGYKDALYRDDASLSYVTTLGNDTWLLSVDAARYKEYTKSSITAGRILPETESWIVNVLDEAQSKNIQVVGMMHWGLTEHIMLQSMFFKNYLVADWQRLANLFADKGMNTIFTGHFHSNDISIFTSDAGNKIYDIETGTLSSYPFSYRFVDLYRDKISVKTRNLESVPGNPNLAKNSKVQMQGIARKLAEQKLRDLDYGFTPDILPLFADMLSQVFIMHAYGDEKPTEKLMQTVSGLSEKLDSPIDLDEMSLDFPPADNNVEIIF